ncbi:MAG: hypothetical protein AAGK05_19360, partial [Pseudomonadota bacterium]
RKVLHVETFGIRLRTEALEKLKISFKMVELFVSETDSELFGTSVCSDTLLLLDMVFLSDEEKCGSLTHLFLRAG